MLYPFLREHGPAQGEPLVTGKLEELAPGGLPGVPPPQVTQPESNRARLEMARGLKASEVRKDRRIGRWNTIESPEINSLIYSPLVLGKDANPIQWGKEEHVPK